MALKTISGKLIKTPNNKLATGCGSGGGTCCVGPLATTMNLTIGGFSNFGVDTSIGFSGICSGQLNCRATGLHAAVNGGYSTTDLITGPSQSPITGRFTLSDGTYAHPGVLIGLLDTYGDVAGPCVLTRKYEIYLTDISCELRCDSAIPPIDSDSGPVPRCPDNCGRHIHAITFGSSVWLVQDTGGTLPRIASLSSDGGRLAIFGGFSLITKYHCGKTFVPSSTADTYDMHGAFTIRGCSNFHDVCPNLSLTVVVS